MACHAKLSATEIGIYQSLQIPARSWSLCRFWRGAGGFGGWGAVVRFGQTGQSRGPV